MKIEFRMVSTEHLEMLRLWRNSERISQFMYSQDYISESQQISWFNSLLANKTCQYFVCYVNDNPTGCLSFTDITDSGCSWGCYIGEPNIWVGTGMALEAAALNFALEYLKLPIIKAEVLSDNKSPQRLHKMFGYDFVSEKAVIRSGRSFNVKIFEYTRENWRSKRNKVVGKLPISISDGIYSISFLDEKDKEIYNYNHD